MQTIIKFTLITALRDFLFIGLIILMGMAYGLSVFTGSTALVEQEQMSIAYFAGSSRIVLMCGLIVFVCFHVRRLFENREIESILSKPVSRVEFVVAYWLGFVVLAFIAIVPVILIMALTYSTNSIGLIYWSASLLLEMSLVIAFALVAALILRSAVSSVMASFTFYFVSRLMGFFVAALEMPGSLLTSGKLGTFLSVCLKTISSVIPRLDLFAKSSWLIYGIGNQNDLWVFQAQAVIFIALLLAMAVFDFKRKEF